MKTITLLLVIILMLKPLLIGFSQVVQNKPDSSQKVVELLNKLDARLDAVNIAVDAKIAEKPVARKPVKQKKPEVIIIYRDTCRDRPPSKKAPIVDSVPGTIKPPEVLPVDKKLKWYQFRKIRQQKKLTDSFIEPNK